MTTAALVQRWHMVMPSSVLTGLHKAFDQEFPEHSERLRSSHSVILHGPADSSQLLTVAKWPERQFLAARGSDKLAEMESLRASPPGTSKSLLAPGSNGYHIDYFAIPFSRYMSHLCVCKGSEQIMYKIRVQFKKAISKTDKADRS